MTGSGFAIAEPIVFILTRNKTLPFLSPAPEADFGFPAARHSRASPSMLTPVCCASTTLGRFSRRMKRVPEFSRGGEDI